MVSIFKATRDNNVDAVRYLINLAHGNWEAETDTISKEDHRYLLHCLAANKEKRYNIARRSLRGRTALHCAATWNRKTIAQLLIESKLFNVNEQDCENGWTPMHCALYAGNVAMALLLMELKEIDLSIKDHDGYRAMELLTDTMAQNRPVERKCRVETNSMESDSMLVNTRNEDVLQGGTALYTWGLNTNYLLGHAIAEHRQSPCWVPLPLETFRPSDLLTQNGHVIQSVHMSKYHTAVLTSKPANNVLLCGFGQRGRLGNGENNHSQLSFVPLQWSERIVAVALGQDHTVAVTKSGTVLTFGSNVFGQLGYEVDHADQTQLVPRKVNAANLKKQPIIGAAASRWHSVVYSETDMFMFGHNQGQLGFHFVGAETRQVTPRKISFNKEIAHVVANDAATAVLFKTYEITLFCNYGQRNIILPMRRFPRTMQVYRSLPYTAVKLVSNNNGYMGALTKDGELFLWKCELATQRENTAEKQDQTAVIGPPKRVWTLSKPHLAARDADIGQQGEVIVCTASGEAFLGTRESHAGEYKFNNLPTLQLCIYVCASPSGAFAAIRSDHELSRPETAPSTLCNDMISSLPHVRISRLLKERGITQRHDTTLATQSSRNSSLLVWAWDEIQAIAELDHTLDTVFVVDGKRIYCHSVMFRCRSATFRKQGHPKWTVKKTMIRGRQQIEIHINTAQLAAFLLLIEYVYTDTFSHPLSAGFELPVLCTGHLIRIKEVQTALSDLATMFELPLLCKVIPATYGYQPVPTLIDDLERERQLTRGDVELLLQKNERLMCHEVILRQRCRFFNTLFEPGMTWVESRREHNRPVQVYLKHIPISAMIPVLRHIYTGLDELALFGDLDMLESTNTIEFLLSVLCVADELIMDQLKTVCERALIGHINLKTVLMLAEYAKGYQAESLLSACLTFMAYDLPAFITNGSLSASESSLILDLEEHVRAIQIEQTPSMNYPSCATVNDNDEEFSFSLCTLARENVSTTLDSVVESYETHYPIRAHKDDDVMFVMDTLAETKESEKEEKTQSVTLIPHPFHTDSQEQNDPHMESRTSGNSWTAPSILISPSSHEHRRPLKEIMEEESQKQVHTRRPSVPDHIPVKKINQKEKRRLQLLEQASAAAAAASPKVVWGNSATKSKKDIFDQSSLSKSFPSAPVKKSTPPRGNGPVLLEEKASKGKKIYVSSQAFLTGDASAVDGKETTPLTSFDATRRLGATFELLPIGQHGRQAAHSERERKSSFQGIQQEQTREDRRKRRPKKSLIRIQAEERAMAGLQEFYVQTIELGSGEWFEMDRYEL